jgi:hypothetical protein
MDLSQEVARLHRCALFRSSAARQRAPHTGDVSPQAQPDGAAKKTKGENSHSVHTTLVLSENSRTNIERLKIMGVDPERNTPWRKQYSATHMVPEPHRTVDMEYISDMCSC